MRATHFGGFDALRFVSVLAVVIHHLFTFKFNYGFATYDLPVIRVLSQYANQFFFVGSGFLISYLLFREGSEYGTINLKNFFIRRILRVWPGYYLLLILMCLVLTVDFFRIPGTTDRYLAADYGLSNALYFAFLPHLQPFAFPTAPYIHHTYTIGIEEQFYVAWGLMFYFFRRYAYWIFLALLILIPASEVLHLLFYNRIQAGEPVPAFAPVYNGVATFLQYSRFSSFAIGSLFAYGYYHQKGWVLLFRKWWVQAAVYGLFVYSVIFNTDVPYFHYEYKSLIVACIMLSGTSTTASIVNYNAAWINYLGRISYGIYLFHMFAIVFTCKLVALVFPGESSWWVTILLCCLTMGMSICFGWASYFYFELYFLKLKQRFKRIPTVP